MSELDYYIVQAGFNPDVVELTYAEDALSSESGAIMSTMQIIIEDDDPEMEVLMRDIQEKLNYVVTRGYQKIKDSRVSEGKS